MQEAELCSRRLQSTRQLMAELIDRHSFMQVSRNIRTDPVMHVSHSLCEDFWEIRYNGLVTMSILLLRIRIPSHTLQAPVGMMPILMKKFLEILSYFGFAVPIQSRSSFFLRDFSSPVPQCRRL